MSTSTSTGEQAAINQAVEKTLFPILFATSLSHLLNHTIHSILQWVGDFGSPMGPLLGALVIMGFGRGSLSWFSVLPLVAIVVLYKVGQWYKAHQVKKKKAAAALVSRRPPLSKTRVAFSVIIL